MKKIFAFGGALATAMLLAGLPTVSFAQVEKTDAFVCPVITAEAVGEHNPQAAPLGGNGGYTIPPHGGAASISVPLHATNGDGSGTPGGDHAAPGDTDYTAIWAVQQ